MSRLLKELRGMDSDSLNKELGEFHRKLFELRYKSVTDHVERNSEFRTFRRQIARILTVLHERELKIRGEK